MLFAPIEACGDEASQSPSIDGGSVDAAPGHLVLAVSSSSVTAEGKVTLTATLSGADSPTRVEFFELGSGGTRSSLGSVAAAPFVHVVEFTFSENGTHTYVATGALASGASISSDPVAVTVAIPANGVFVDPALGLDTNAGSQAAPFKTIAKAASVVADGQTIYLFGGTYDQASQPALTFTNATFVRGFGSSKPLIVGTGSSTSAALTFAKGGGIRDVSFRDLFAAVSAAAGSFSARGLVFEHVAEPLTFKGTTSAEVDATGSGAKSFVSNAPAEGLFVAVLRVEDSAKVTWKGGAVGDLKAGFAAFQVSGSGELVADGLAVTNVTGRVFSVFDDGKLTIRNATIANSGSGASGDSLECAICMGGQDTKPPLAESLTIEGTSMTASRGSAIYLGLRTALASKHVVTVANSHVDGSTNNGLFIPSPGALDPGLTVTLTSTNTTFDANGGVGITASHARMNLTGGEIAGNAAGGVVIGDFTFVNSLRMRNVKLAGNGGNMISFDGAAASALDLGKAGDPGGLLFSGVAAAGTALNHLAPIAASAVGNTWIPNQQGADATGKFAAGTTLVGPTIGINVALDNGSSVLLAP